MHRDRILVVDDEADICHELLQIGLIGGVVA